MGLRYLVAIATFTVTVAATPSQDIAPDVMASTATAKLEKSLQATRAHARHVWRDTPPTNADQTVNAYIEISHGDRRKWELDMGANARTIDRVIPESGRTRDWRVPKAPRLGTAAEEVWLVERTHAFS